MKKAMCLLALAGLIVGCAHTRNNAGGTSDQIEMNSGAYSSAPAAPETRNIYSNPTTTPNIINNGSSP